jgi:hypothetical protein
MRAPDSCVCLRPVQIDPRPEMDEAWRGVNTAKILNDRHVDTWNSKNELAGPVREFEQFYGGDGVETLMVCVVGVAVVALMHGADR